MLFVVLTAFLMPLCILASWESIKYVRILPHDFSTETGELTPSLKVKRKVVAEKHHDVIEGLYR